MADLTRRDASTAVAGLGWRLVPGGLHTTVPVASLAGATACGRLTYTDEAPAFWVLADPGARGPA
jgi:hypothetical protein